LAGLSPMLATDELRRWAPPWPPSPRRRPQNTLSLPLALGLRGPARGPWLPLASLINTNATATKPNSRSVSVALAIVSTEWPAVDHGAGALGARPAEGTECFWELGGGRNGCAGDGECRELTEPLVNLIA
jgi:hypothetical protein